MENDNEELKTLNQWLFQYFSNKVMLLNDIGLSKPQANKLFDKTLMTREEFFATILNMGLFDDGFNDKYFEMFLFNRGNA